MRTLRYSVAASLWGGGNLCRELAVAGLLDGIDVAVIPVVLGNGLPMMATPGPQLSLKLRTHRLYAQTGTCSCNTTSPGGSGADPGCRRGQCVYASS